MKAYDKILSTASALSTSLIKKTNSPVDAKTIANNIDEVLAMDDNWKFEGLFVYIIEEHMFYSFQGGITNDCFKPIGGTSSNFSFEDFSETKTYTMDDYIVYDNKL